MKHLCLLMSISTCLLSAAERDGEVRINIPRLQQQMQDAEECPICLDLLSTQHVVQLKCHQTHQFHKICLDEHFCQKEDPCCPLCRAPMNNYINPEHIKSKHRWTVRTRHLSLVLCDRNNCHLISAGALATTFGFLILKLTGII